MKEVEAAADVAVADHKAKLPIAAIDDENLVVKPAGGAGEAYVKDTDYSTYYDGEFLVIEVLSDGEAYAAEQVNVAYNKVKPDSVDDTAVATGMESIEQCLTTLGIVPDLICAPGHSQSSVVAAVMATKAGGINGMFQAKALIDIDSSSAGATSYTAAITEKSGNNFVDVDELTCWPMLKLGDYKFHMSTQLAGLIAQVDTGNGGCPYESPSNKNFQCDAMVLEDGTEVNLTLAQANILNEQRHRHRAELHGRLVRLGQLYRLLSLQHRREGLLHPRFPDVRLGRQHPDSAPSGASWTSP